MTHRRVTVPAAGLLAALALAPAALAQDSGNAGQQGLGERPPGQVRTPNQQMLPQVNRPDAPQQVTATTVMKDAKGKPLGTVAFAETPNGVLVQARLENVPPGQHGFHVHEAGKCDPPDFKTAGGHFNPGGKAHGYLNPKGPHAGDLPVLFVGEDGKGAIDVLAPGLSLRPGANSLLPSGSRSLVLHDGIDDYVSDPAGNSGGRIACGIIEVPMAADAGTQPPKPGGK